MAFQYNANQYELAFKPQALGNWEVPKVYTYNEEFPKARKGKTAEVANNKGHLLPGAPRSNRSPWGNYCGTWHMPNKIDRETADKLNGSFYLKKPSCKERREQAKKLEEERKLEDAKAAQEKESKEEKVGVEESKTESAAVKPEEKDALEGGDKTPKPELDTTTDFDIKEINKENIDENKSKARPYVPGDFTEEKHKHESYYQLAKNRYTNREDFEKHDSSKGYPKCKEDFSRKAPTPEPNLTEQVDEFYKKHKEMKEATYPVAQNKHKEKNKERLLSPIIAAISNFSLAKKLHRENLEHDPLPDTLNDAIYRKLQLQRRQLKDPGLELKNGTFATGVGWKGYPGYGPTRCTKLKVYRPKTCVQDKVIEKDERPASVSSFDKKWRFIRQRKVSPIQLAICWDLSPENVNDEPKPPTHIDGSNGSQAPAVFTLVHTPKEPNEESISKKNSLPEVNCDGIHGCGTIFQHGVPKNDQPKNYFFERPKTSSLNSVKSVNSNKRAKSAYNINKICEENNNESSSNSSSNNNSSKVGDKIFKSTPNLSNSCSQCSSSNKTKLKNRLCVACELQNDGNFKGKPRPKSDYKLAFKAGVPQNKQYKNRRDYPDHWRLATVYQHSYKPIQARKRPLLQTVFK